MTRYNLMKKYIRCADNSGYGFYVDDVYDGYGDYLFTVKAKSLSDFEAEVSVTEGFGDVEVEDCNNYGDMADDAFEEILEDCMEDIESVVVDYMYDNDLAYMDSQGRGHILYK